MCLLRVFRISALGNPKLAALKKRKLLHSSRRAGLVKLFCDATLLPLLSSDLQALQLLRKRKN